MFARALFENACRTPRTKFLLQLNLYPRTSKFSLQTYFRGEHYQSLSKSFLIGNKGIRFQNRGIFFRIIDRKRLSSDAQNIAKEGSTKKSMIPKSSELKRILLLAKPERNRIIGAIGLLLISSAVTISVPFALGRVIDTIYKGASEDGEKMMENLKSLCKFLGVIFLCGAVANFGRLYLMGTSGQRIIKRLREDMFKSIMRQDVAFFDKTRTGELINRLSTDTEKVGASLTKNVADGLRSLVQVIGGIGMMFYTSAQLTLVVLTIVPPISVLSIIYGRFVRNLSKRVQDSLAKTTELAEERISSVRTVRAFAQEGRECRVYSNQVEDVFQLSKKETILWGLFFSSMGLSGNMIILSVLYYGGHMMTDSLVSVGDLSAFLLYAAYVGISLSGLSSFYTELMRGIGASTRLFELLDRQARIPLRDGFCPSVSQMKGHLEFKNLQFAYPSRPDVTIFSNFSLTAPAGSVTAIVGASGSGKSTLGSLLLRYYDPGQGSIELDGRDIQELSPEWLRHQIGTVSQEPILFSTTIAKNIAYGAIDPDNVVMEEIYNAAKTANAFSFIQGFPNGFDTIVGERGLMLSGGQRQRIALARAVLKNPKIILLDEATSALDAESEYLVQEALERVMVGRTVITIAHRLSTIKNADAIAVLQNGCIAEIGSYNQLISVPDGVFRKLVEKQTLMS